MKVVKLDTRNLQDLEESGHASDTDSGLRIVRCRSVAETMAGD